MSREKDTKWNISKNAISGSYDYQAAHLAVLMDLRDELKQLNRVFSCYNFQQLPEVLRQIRRNTANLPKRRPKK